MLSIHNSSVYGFPIPDGIISLNDFQRVEALTQLLNSDEKSSKYNDQDIQRLFALLFVYSKENNNFQCILASVQVSNSQWRPTLDCVKESEVETNLNKKNTIAWLEKLRNAYSSEARSSKKQSTSKQSVEDLSVETYIKNLSNNEHKILSTLLSCYLANYLKGVISTPIELEGTEPIRVETINLHALLKSSMYTEQSYAVLKILAQCDSLKENKRGLKLKILEINTTQTVSAITEKTNEEASIKEQTSREAIETVEADRSPNNSENSPKIARPPKEHSAQKAPILARNCSSTNLLSVELSGTYLQLKKIFTILKSTTCQKKTHLPYMEVIAETGNIKQPFKLVSTTKINLGLAHVDIKKLQRIEQLISKSRISFQRIIFTIFNYLEDGYDPNTSSTWNTDKNYIYNEALWNGDNKHTLANYLNGEKLRANIEQIKEDWQVIIGIISLGCTLKVIFSRPRTNTSINAVLVAFNEKPEVNTLELNESKFNMRKGIADSNRSLIKVAVTYIIQTLSMGEDISKAHIEALEYMLKNNKLEHPLNTALSICTSVSEKVYTLNSSINPTITLQELTAFLNNAITNCPITKNDPLLTHCLCYNTEFDEQTSQVPLPSSGEIALVHIHKADEKSTIRSFNHSCINVAGAQFHKLISDFLSIACIKTPSTNMQHQIKLIVNYSMALKFTYSLISQIKSQDDEQAPPYQENIDTNHQLVLFEKHITDINQSKIPQAIKYLQYKEQLFTQHTNSATTTETSEASTPSCLEASIQPIQSTKPTDLHSNNADKVSDPTTSRKRSAAIAELDSTKLHKSKKTS